MALAPGVRNRGRKLQIYFQHRGKTRSRTLELPPTAAGVAQAIRLLAEWKSRVRYGLPDPALADEHSGNPVTFVEVAQAYLDSADVKLSTRNTYRDLLNGYWIPHLGDPDLQRIRYRDLRRIDLNSPWPGPLLRKNAITALRRVFDFAIGEDYLQENPAAQLRVRRVQRAAGPDPFTAAEREFILQWLAEHQPGTQHLAGLIAFGTGMRTGEIIALRWEDWDGLTWTVERSRVRGVISTVKTDVARRVTMTEDDAALIEGYRTPFVRTGWVLNTKSGEPYRYPGKAFRGYRAALAALDIRPRSGPYPWRHTYASLGLIDGLSDGFLARQLGHSRDVFHRNYARWIESDRDLNEMEKMAAGRRAAAEQLKRKREGGAEERIVPQSLSKVCQNDEGRLSSGKTGPRSGT